MKNILRSVTKTSVVITTLFVSIFGIFALDQIEISAKPNDTITLPGGTSSNGTDFSDFEFEKDSQRSGGYGQDTSKFKRTLDNPVGVYSGDSYATVAGNVGENQVRSSVNNFVDTGDGYIATQFAQAYPAGTYLGAQSKIKKYDYNFNLLFNNGAMDNRQSLHYTILDPETTNSTYTALLASSELAKVNKSDGQIVSLSPRLSLASRPGTEIADLTAVTPSGWIGAGTYKPVSIDHGNIYKIDFDTMQATDHKDLNNPYGFKISTPGKKVSVKTEMFELENGNFVIKWLEQDSGSGYTKAYGGLTLYDSSFNIINKFMLPEAEVDVNQDILFLTTSKAGNPIFQISNPNNNKKRIIEYNASDGLIEKEADFTIEQAFFSKAINLNAVQEEVSYYFIGNAMSEGRFSGFDLNGTGGVVLAGMDEDFNVISANFLSATGQYTFQTAMESANSKIMVSGNVAPADRELFNNQFLGKANPIQEGFIGTFEQVLDYAPKLLIPKDSSIILDGINVDEKMLQYIKNDMNGETNKYDDYTTNAELLERINKNVYNTDYRTTPIDWTKFGLEKVTNNKGIETYQTGRYDVTYAVADGQLNQSVVSGPVNICTPETVTDKDDCNNDEAKFALDAQNYRIEKGTSNASLRNDVINRSKAKAWDMTTGTEETANASKVTVDSAQLDASKVGVYPVEITYETATTPITKTIYVTVYDDSVISGPEDEDNSDPDNMKNSELLSAIDAEMSIYEAKNTHGSNAINMVQGKGWYANPTSLTTIDIDPIYVTNMKRVKDESGTDINEQVTVNNGVFDVKLGEYEVTLGTRLTGGAEKTVTLKINKNSQPVLTSTPYIELALGANIPTYAGLLAEVELSGDPKLSKDDIEITAINTNRVIPHNGTVEQNDINTSVPGIYTIHYHIQNDEGNFDDAYTNYVVGVKVLDNQYVIMADNFDIKIDDVTDSNDGTLKQQVKEKSNYHGFKLVDEEGKGTNGKNTTTPVNVQNLGTYGKVLGGHKIVLEIAEKTTVTKDIYANVYDTGNPAGKYIIEGNDKTMTLSDAKAALATSTIVDAPFNDVWMWEKDTDGKERPVAGVNYDNPFSFTEAAIKPGDYTYIVSIGEGQDKVSRTFKVTVVKDGDPILEVTPTVVNVPLGTTHDAISKQLLDGVEAHDGAAGNAEITPTVKLSLVNGEEKNTDVTDLTDINTAENGIYKYTYYVKDSQGIELEAERYYVVGNDPVIDVDNNLVLFADNYYIEDDKVVYNNPNNEAQKEAGTELRNLATGKKMTQAIKITKNEQHYSKTAGYTDSTRTKHKVGPFPLTFTAEVSGNKIEKPIIANVVNDDVDYNEGGAAIYQVSKELRRSEAVGKAATTITEVKVWDTTNGNPLVVDTDYMVDDVQDFDGTEAKELSYYTDYHVIVTVRGGAGPVSDKIIKVIPGGAPTLVPAPRVVNDVVEMSLEESKDFDVDAAIDIQKAWDNEDTGGQTGEYDRALILVNSDKTTFEKNKVGTFLVTYSITDKDWNTTEKTLAYVVGSKGATVNTAIYANSFDLDKKTELETTGDIETLVKQADKSGVRADSITRDSNDNITGITAISLGDIVFENVDNLATTSPVGGYKVKFTADDVNTTVVANVIDETVIKGDKVYISATSATRRPGQIDKTRDTAQYLTEVKAWNRETGAEETVTNTGLKETTNYKAENVTKPMAHTEFPVKYEATNDPTAIKDVTITITPGDSPVITVDDPVINLAVDATAPTVLTGVEVDDTEDGDRLVVTPLPAQVATNKKGVTVVKYTTVDSDGNPGENKRSYVVGAKDPQPNDEVAIFANSFAIQKSDFDFGATEEEMNKAIIKLAGPALAQKIADGSKVDVEVKDAVSFKTGTVGPHDIVLKAGDKEVTIVGSIYDKGTVKDGQVIEANDATVRQGDVIGMSAYDVLDSKTPGNIRAWNVEDGTATNVSVTNEAPTYTGLKSDSPFIITLTTDEGKSIDRKIVVTTVAGPILTNNIPLVKIPIDGPEPTITDIMNGIEIEHVDEAELMQALQDEKTLELNAKPIKTNEPGVYVVSYKVTDKEDDSSEVAYRTYVIGDGVVTNDSVIFANNFKIEKKDVEFVDENGAQEAGLEGELVEKTGAKAYLREPNTPGKGIDDAKPVDVKLESTTYKKAVGGYPVELKADGKSATKTVTASVVDNEDDGKGEADDEYGIQAYSKTYRPSLAFNKSLASLVDAKAWKVEDASEVTPVITATATDPDGVVVTLNETEWLTKWPHLHEHPDNTVWTVKVVAGDVEVEVDLTIDPEEKPVLSFTDNQAVQEVDLGAANVDVKKFLAVSDDYDTLTKNDVTVTPATLDTSEKGVRVLTYRVMDSDQNVGTIERSFIVRDSREDGVGNKYAIFATNYVKHINEYNASDSAVIEDSKVFVQEIKTEAVIPDSALPGTIKIDSNQFKKQVGAHPIGFKVKTDPQAEANIIASLVEDDINIPDDKEIVLRGAHFNDLAQKAKDKDIIDDITTATAWHRVTGVPVDDVSYIFNSASYDITDPVPGNYSVKLSAPGAKDVDRNITLRAGGKPTLRFENNSEIVAVPVLGTQIDVYEDVLGTDAEDTPNPGDKYDNGVANTPEASREKALVYATGSVDTATEGVYKVTYDVTDLDHNKADTITRIYVVGDATYNDKYALFAHDFQEKVDTMEDDDDYLKEMAGPGTRDVYGVRFSDLAEVDAIVAFDGAETYKVEARKPNRDDRIAGLHKIEFVIPEDTTPEKLKKTINANTTKHISPIEPKPEYYIDAKDRTIHVSKVGNQTPEQLTDMQAWDTETGAKPTVKMKSTPEFKAEVGVYTIKYDVVVSGVSKATHTVVIDVIEGDKPEIEVDPDVKEIKLGTDINAINFYEDAKAWDTEDTPGQDEIYPTGSVNEQNKQKGIFYADGNINTNQQGTYIYTYSVTDLDGNYVEAKRSYVVDGKVGNEYALFANNFDINIKDVAEAAGVEAQLQLKTNAHSHKYADPTVAGDTYLDDDGGYRAEAGPYDVTYKVTEDPGLSKTIVASVHDGAVGTKDIMHAINGTIRPSQITTNTVKDLTESKAWDKNTKAAVDYTYEVFDKDDNLVVFESPQPTGEYKVIFTTEHGTVLERTITVIPGEFPVITDDTNVVEVAKGATGIDFYDDIKATDAEDTPNPGDKYQTGAVNESNKVPGKLYADGTVDTSQSGLYIVGYTITDSDGNTTTTQRSYVVDGNAGLTHAIFADNFDIKVEDVAATVEARTGQLFTKSNARTYPLLDPNNKGVTLLNNDGGYKAEAGPYKVVFESGDEPGLTKQIIASVHDGAVGTEDVMHAVNGVVRPDQIDANTVKKVTESKAWDLDSGDPVDYDYEVKDENGVLVDFTTAQPLGVYTVYFETENGTKLERTITVVPGLPPVLEVDPTVIELSLEEDITTLDVYDGVRGTDDEDTPGVDETYPNGPVNEAEINKQPAIVYANGTIDTTEAGTYIVVYEVTDLDGNKVTAQRSYVVDGKVGTQYALFAHDFDIKLEDVATTPNGINQQLFTKTEAKSHKIKEPQTAGTTQLIDDGGYKAEAGPYHITFDVFEEPGLEKTVVASVHNGQVGDKDIMHAIDGIVRPGQINATTVETVTESKAWNKSNGTDVLYDYEVKNANGDVVEFNQPQPLGFYDVTFTTENGTTLTRQIEVIPGDAPLLDVDPAIIELSLGADAPDVYDDVTGTDTEDTPGGAEYPKGAIDEANKVYEVVYADGSVDTSEPGVYVINYIVTDSDGNTTKASRSYIVEGKKGTDYAIFANNFDILVNQVATTPETVTDQLYERTGAKTQKITDSTIIGKPKITSDGGYKAEAGPYKVDFEAEEEPGLTKQIIASVHAGNVGMQDVMHAVDATVRPNEIVPGIVEQVTESKAWDKNTGDPVDYDFEVKDKAGNVVDFTSPQPVGSYKVTFTTEHGTVLERTITVILGNAPELKVDPKVVELTLGETVPDFYTGVDGTDEEDTPGGAKYPNGAINEATKVPGFVYADGTVDSSQSGTYVVTYQVTDLDGNYVDAQRSYVVDGKVGTHYALFADSFEIATGDVAQTAVDRKKQLFDNTHARSELITDPTQKGTTNLTEDSGYSAVAGGYPITFNVNEEQTVTKTVMANVHDGVIGTQDVMHAVDATIRPSQIKPGIVEEVTESKAWDKNTGDEVDYTYEVKNAAGDIVDFTVLQPIGEYKVTFITDNGTVLERTITVIAGEAPKLTVDPEIIELEYNENAQAPDLLLGVVATDKEDTNNTPYTDGRIQHTGTVDTSTPGEYVITYSVTDNDGNTTTAERTYKVIISEKASFSIAAESVTLKMDVFEKAKRDGTLEELLLKESKARAQRDNDNKEVSPVKVDTTKLKDVKVVGTTKTIISHEITKDEMKPYEELDTSNGQTKKSETRADDDIVGTVSKDLEIILIDKSKPTLPITGEKTKELMVVGTGLISLSLLIFYIRRKTDK